jgi:hypothetical protein
MGMRHRIVLGMLLFCTGLLAVVQPAKADTIDGVTFTLTSPDLTGRPGDPLIWNYNLINNEPGGLDALIVNVNVPAAFNVGDGLPQLFLNTSGQPPIVANGTTQTDTLYEFLSNPLVPNSTNTGSFQVDVWLLDSQGFLVNTIQFNENYSATITSSTSVPEPGSLLLLASGLLAGLLVSRRAAH